MEKKIGEKNPKNAGPFIEVLLIIFFAVSALAFASVFHLHRTFDQWTGKFKNYLAIDELLVVFSISMFFFAILSVRRARELKAEAARHNKVLRAMKDSETRYRRLFESAQDGILILDADIGEIFDVNPFLTKLLGYSPEELIGKKLWEIGLFKDIAASRKAFEELQMKEYIRYECLPLEKKEGGPVEVEFVSNVYWVDHKKIIQCNIRDITKRKETEEDLKKSWEDLEKQVEKRTEELAKINLKLQDEIIGHKESESFLRRSEEKYRTLIENLTQKIFFKNVDLVYVSCNKNYARDLAIDPCDITGKTDFDFFPRQFAEKYRCDDRRVMESGKTENIEEKYIGEGQIKIIHTVKTPVKNEWGNTIGVLGIFWDITAQKKAEEALRESEERYRKIIAAMTDYIYTVYFQGGKVTGTMYGHACLSVTGYAPAEFQNDPYLWIKIVPENDRERVSAWGTRILANEPAEPIEHQIVRKDGAIRWIRNTPVLRHNVQGELVSYDGVIKDVTEQKTAEQERTRADALSLIVEGTPDAIVIVDSQARIRQLNKAAEHLLGYRMTDILERDLGDFVPAVNKPAVPEIVKGCFQSGFMNNVEFNVLTKGGEEIPVLANATLLRDVHGNPQKSLLVITDITVLRQAEKKLKETIETKSAFTSMVSHELRTPLSVIKESVSLLSEGLVDKTSEEQRSYFEMCRRNIDRLSRLINNVLDFQKLVSGMRDPDVNENDINDIVLEVFQAMEMLASKRNLGLVLELAENLPKVNVNRDEIIQALTNLVGNALKFTERGKIFIVTGKKGNEVLVKVRDDGVGIAPENMPKLFHSFQRFGDARLKKGGTGLGLAITREIIERHRGSIWAESELGKGTTFHFVLPVFHETAGEK